MNEWMNEWSITYHIKVYQTKFFKQVPLNVNFLEFDNKYNCQVDLVNSVYKVQLNEEMSGFVFYSFFITANLTGSQITHWCGCLV